MIKNQKVQIKLPDIKLTIDKNISKIIEVGELESGEKLFIEVKWPTVGFAIKILETTEEIEKFIEESKDEDRKIPKELDETIQKKWELQNASMMKLLIKKLYDDKGQVFDLDDVSNEEFMVYMNKSLTSSFQKFEEFIENVPKLSHKIEWKCRTCKKNHTIDIEGLESFL